MRLRTSFTCAELLYLLDHPPLFSFEQAQATPLSHWGETDLVPPGSLL